MHFWLAQAAAASNAAAAARGADDRALKEQNKEVFKANLSALTDRAKDFLAVDPQTAENGLEVELEHPMLGHMRMVGPPFQMSETPLAAQGPSPMLGEHTDETLGAAGFSEAEIGEMRGAGVIL